MLLLGCGFLGACAAPAGPAALNPYAAAGGFLERAAEALRSRGHRVDRSSGGVVRSRPRPVPSGLEPWRSGPGAGGLPLAAAATLGEVREVATLREEGGGAVEAEVWLERARRPDRRLVVRAGGDVFSDAGLLGVFDEGPSRFGADGPGVADPVTTPGLDPTADAGGIGAPDAVGPRSLVPFPQAAAATARRRAGVQWDRWRRLPGAEARLLAAYEAAGG